MAAGMNKRYLLAAFILLLRRRRRRRQRRLSVKPTVPEFWVREIFAKREQLGEFHTLVKEMRKTDRESSFR